MSFYDITNVLLGCQPCQWFSYISVSEINSISMSSILIWYQDKLFDEGDRISLRKHIYCYDNGDLGASKAWWWR